MQFRVLIKNSDGSLQWEVPFVSFRFAETLNQDRNAQITFARQEIEAIAEASNTTFGFILKGSYREVDIYDGDTLLYSGFLDEYQASTDGLAKGNITMTSRGFFSLLSKRFTNSARTYTAQDAGDIAWDLINYTQGLTSGDRGITRGSHPATKNRDRTYRFANIADEIAGLSNDNVKDGFDFEVDTTKVFNIYFPEKGSLRPTIIFEHGFNIDGYQVTENGLMGMANQVIVAGDGFGDGMLSATRSAAADYAANYGLLQDITAEKDVTEAATLNDKGDKYLDRNKYPRKTLALTVDYNAIPFTDYGLGDRVKVKISQEDVNDFYRVLSRTVDQSGAMSLTLETI